MKHVVYRVGGMVCSHCESAVQDALYRLPGVKKAKASQRKRQVRIDYDESLLNADTLVAAIDNTGYQVYLDET